jgi:hypothetical protein
MPMSLPVPGVTKPGRPAVPQDAVFCSKGAAWPRLGSWRYYALAGRRRQILVLNPGIHHSHGHGGSLGRASGVGPPAPRLRDKQTGAASMKLLGVELVQRSVKYDPSLIGKRTDTMAASPSCFGCSAWSSPDLSNGVTSHQVSDL